MNKLFYFVLLDLIIIVTSKSWVREFTVILEASKSDCYFLPDLKEKEKVYITYQTSEGDSMTGDVRIDATFNDPYGGIIQTHFENEESQSSGYVDHSVEVPGDYKFCIINRSGWSGTNVYIDIDVEDVQDDYYDDFIPDEDMNDMRHMDEEYENSYEMKIIDIKDALHRIKSNTGNIHHSQTKSQARHTKDLNMAIRNGEKVTFWSIIHITCLLFTGLIQVAMVKSLFEDKAFLHKFVR